jgi:transcription antitermination factor NusG
MHAVTAARTNLTRCAFPRTLRSWKARYLSHVHIVTDLRAAGITELSQEIQAASMPILRKESDIYPETLFEMPTDEAPWEIAHLRSRQEKAVARILLDSGMPFYLPQVRQTTKRSGRTFVSHLPLFPGYIFLRRVDGLRQTLWRTTAVANMIDVPDQGQLSAELAQIRQLQLSGAVMTPRQDLVPGDAVRITEGSFSGYCGVVTEERGTLRLIVQVSILKKSIAVEFPREMLSRVKAAEVNLDRKRL